MFPASVTTRLFSIARLQLAMGVLFAQIVPCSACCCLSEFGCCADSGQSSSAQSAVALGRCCSGEQCSCCCTSNADSFASETVGGSEPCQSCPTGEACKCSGDLSVAAITASSEVSPRSDDSSSHDHATFGYRIAAEPSSVISTKRSRWRPPPSSHHQVLATLCVWRN